MDENKKEKAKQMIPVIESLEHKMEYLLELLAKKLRKNKK